VENAPEPGQSKKPTPAAGARSGGSARKPPVRKPAAKRPTASRAVKPPADKPVDVDAAPAESPVVDDAVVEETIERAPAATSKAEASRPVAEVVDDSINEETTERRVSKPPVKRKPAAQSKQDPKPQPTEAPEATPEPQPTEEPELLPESASEAESTPEPAPEQTAEGDPEPEGSQPGAESPVSSTLSAASTALKGWTKRVSDGSTTRVSELRSKVESVRAARAEAAALPPVEANELFPESTGRAPKKAAETTVLSVSGLTKRFDDTVAVDGINLEVKVGEFYGIVGPNGAGKTTTLSMITGLLRPDSGTVTVNGVDVWKNPIVAKRSMGVLPDRLRLFDRLTGAQLLYYAGVLRGLDARTVKQRTADLAQAFGLEDALGRLVSDYSAGMTKQVALAAAMIHSPRLLVLDEPFESVDPVSAATVTGILKKYVSAGGTVVLSSHSMDLVQRICDHVAVVVNGEILADGTVEAVRDGRTLEERFVELAGGRETVEGLEWLHSFSD